MKMNALFAKMALAAVIGAVATFPTFAIGAQDSFTGSRIEIQSGKSFEDVTDAIGKLVAKNGMMVMAEVDQGKMLSMTGLQLKAKLFLIGNPTVGKKLFEQNHAVGLYVPLRVFVYNDANGKTFVAYDKPSSVLSQFDSAEVGMVAKMLDEKLDGLASMAAK
jgi:uncharacterized protein (DUF302 family)